MSEDEKLTEKQALEQAKKDGVEFVDTFTIVSTKEFGKQLDEKEYDTRAKAEKALEKLDSKDATIMQTRARK